MARVPDIIRRNPISQVAAEAPKKGQGWAALADLAGLAAQKVKPAALKAASEEGLKGVYRDADGTLKVTERSALGGEMADAYNTAAYAKYLAQRKIDMSQSFTELAQANEFDPAGFKDAAAGYLKILQEDETVPAAIKEELLLDAQGETNNRFNGLFQAETRRTQQDANVGTKTHRDMLVDDYVNLSMGGDTKGAEAKFAEIEQLSRFRQEAAYISETPEETAAFLRGVRGAAKVASLAQHLGESMSSDTISDDLRAEIDATLADPDVDPDTRRKLYTATQARLKGVDAAAVVNGLTADSYEAKVVRNESGGRNDAQNLTSSALGRHQFIAGTWLENVREIQSAGGAPWATGLSDAEILAKRGDGAISSEVFAHFRAKNAAALSGAGLPVNDATEYMAHFFGAGGAVKVLSSDPNAMIKDILPGVAKANAFMANMTVQDATNWAARKMTVKASDIAGQQAVINQIDDIEVRGMASERLNQQYRLRLGEEALAQDEYQTRIGTPGDTVSTSEIMQDHRLSDLAQTQLSATLTKMREDQSSVQNTIAQLATGAGSFNMFDNGDQKAVAGAYTSILGDDPPLSPRGVAIAAETTKGAGFVPKPMFDALRGAAASNNPAEFGVGMEAAGRLLADNPNAISMYGNNSEVTGKLADYSFYAGFMGSEAAAARVIENNSPDNLARRKNLSDAAKTAAKELKPADLVTFLSAKGVSVELGSTGQQGEMMAEYERLFQDAFVLTGASDLAKNRALTEMSRIYGPNGVTGGTQVMKYPPQAFYPVGMDGTRKWMTDQIVRDVSTELNDGVMPQPIVGRGGFGTLPNPHVIDSADIVISSDETTRQDISAGRAPTYSVLYMGDDGLLQPLPKRYAFDASVAAPLDPGLRSAVAAKTIKDDRVRQASELAIRKEMIARTTELPIGGPGG